ncbi:MAG TPA: nucleotidyl transferase AbiEii/AbiGii toxin family protein [Gammaproteobacteria bacterium]|nr:nucleotidyl transferase AbiEii/AbiGii toxin family protein [Gammaproteobacteria bacterium]
MPEAYLTLSPKEQSQILRSLSTNPEIKRDALLLEKDIWICWALSVLFNMPNRLPMAFKGGTSLSKAFHVIDRFSEDVDITIDYQSLNCGNPFENSLSKTKLKNISLALKSALSQYIKDTITPHYEKTILEQFKENPPIMEMHDDGETLHLRYPSVIEQKSGYIIDSIRLEFGGRNLTTPNEPIVISTDISKHIKNLILPTAEVAVLSPQKTYWEKLTLIHYECNRPTLKEDANRISRHWYDVAMLSKHLIGKEALSNRSLLQEVIKIKKTFYDSGFAKYDECINGNMRLIPNNDYLKLLKDDFDKMLGNKMFYGEQPDFYRIIHEVKQLETIINQN